MYTPDPYDFSADSALEIASRISSLPAPLGHPQKIPAKSSPTYTRDTIGLRSASERSSPAKMPDLAKRVSKPGSISPQRKRLRPPISRVFCCFSERPCFTFPSWSST